MKRWMIFIFSFFFSFNSMACEQGSDEFELAVKIKLQSSWKELPQFQQPKFDALPYTFSRFEKVSDSSYRIYATRGESLCKRFTYSVAGDDKCVINTTLLSIDGCPAEKF